MADLTNNGSGNLNSAAKKADDVTSKIANPGAMATSTGLGAGAAGIGGAIASKTSAISSAADISKLSNELPGGLGNSVARASQLTNEMQNMKCPSFEPNMPGAAKAEELQGHLDTISQSAEQLKNPLGSQINSAQDALTKVQENPSVENINNLKDKSQALKSQTCALYCSDAAQKAKDYGNQAVGAANSAAALAQQKAIAAAQASAKKYTDQANAMSADILNKVNTDEAFKNNAQQSMLNKAQSMPIPLNMNSAAAAAALSQGVCAELSKRYPDSQDTIQHVNNAIQNSSTIIGYIQAAQMAGIGSGAASQMQGQLPQTSAAGSALPSNPYTNANNLIQSLTLPDCPQLKNLQTALSSAQGNFNQGVYGNPISSQLQQVQSLQQQYEGLPDSTKQQMGSSGNPFNSPVQCMQDNIKAQESTGSQFIVVAGAKGNCVFGGQFTVVAPPDGVTVKGMSVAQPLDILFEPAGICNSLANPITAAQTSAALGVLTPGPCLLVGAPITIPAAWTIVTGEKFLIDEQPCLLSGTCGQCIYGGMLTITDPGQEDVTAAAAG